MVNNSYEHIPTKALMNNKILMFFYLVIFTSYFELLQIKCFKSRINSNDENFKPCGMLVGDFCSYVCFMYLEICCKGKF